ncbi:hypothetical protein ACN42_g1306 [Penicillium freii]|uniref:Uncharacterized protein n=1 Tax=Penicillium freii TaxID=48697 RepID=A0A117NRP5_PENFR|nr:hypothetical protein ACN42_g1306 [Penicillium freii]
MKRKRKENKKEDPKVEKKQSGRERSYHATRCTTLKRTIIERRKEVEEEEGDKKEGKCERSRSLDPKGKRSKETCADLVRLTKT